ncbi:hypothetical protein SAMN05216559_4028 [Halomicrobium zhouii]|uniref:Uncharacterized protein n=1 Tax=Halomicrobium zhouii TaxID=767519 RepID=A0A1I6M967_9EURY|nr:hypothetical protein [Halomicrobium zhouii]SFS12163.1 hypothetical protein SAMN05216559_4028 [Halomicrobium zhouii]
MRDGSPTRRGFLAAAGTTLLAGCGSLEQLGEDDRETVYAHELPQAAEDGDVEPILGEDVPVDIERTVLDERRQRVTELLDTLPMAFGPADVPNGYVRERLVGAAEDATEYVDDARTAETRLSALESLREARCQARYAATGWAFVDEELTESAVQADHEAAVDDAESLESDHEYVGTDPVDAALVHARVERNLRLVLDNEPPSIYARESPLLTVAEWGEHAETARARVADSRYLYDRFTSSLPDDPGTVEETLDAAAESLAADLRERREELPPEPTEDDYDLVDRLRYDLRDEVEWSAERVTEAQGPASAVLAATDGLTDSLAFDRFKERVDDGESFGAESVADVRETRTTALDAIRTALSESPRPALARPVLAEAAWTVAWADESLGRFHGEVDVRRLDDPMERYATATLRARSVPTAVEQVVDVLGG